MNNLDNTLFQLKFTSKQLTKQANKANKEEQKEILKLKKALKDNNQEIAKIYASNSIRKKNENLQLLKLSSRIDSVASRVQTAITMRNVSGNMLNVCKGMDRALQSMNLQQITMIMDKFEQQFEDLDTSINVYEEMGQTSDSIIVDNDKVDELLNKVADENGIELRQQTNTNQLPELTESSSKQQTVVSNEKEDRLAERLKALRG